MTKKPRPRPLGTRPGTRADGSILPWGIYCEGKLVDGCDTRAAAEHDARHLTRMATLSDDRVRRARVYTVARIPGGTERIEPTANVFDDDDQEEP